MKQIPTERSKEEFEFWEAINYVLDNIYSESNPNGRFFIRREANGEQVVVDNQGFLVAK